MEPGPLYLVICGASFTCNTVIGIENETDDRPSEIEYPTSSTPT